TRVLLSRVLLLPRVPLARVLLSPVLLLPGGLLARVLLLPGLLARGLLLAGAERLRRAYRVAGEQRHHGARYRGGQAVAQPGRAGTPAHQALPAAGRRQRLQAAEFDRFAVNGIHATVRGLDICRSGRLSRCSRLSRCRSLLSRPHRVKFRRRHRAYTGRLFIATSINITDFRGATDAAGRTRRSRACRSRRKRRRTVPAGRGAAGGT